jgi:hypothetical protein
MCIFAYVSRLYGLPVYNYLFLHIECSSTITQKPATGSVLELV